MDPQTAQTPITDQSPPPTPQPDQSLVTAHQSPTYDVIIIGGGPAGVAAAVYTARKQLKTLLITDNFGGQSIVSDDIQNWIGDQHVSGVDLATRLENHIRAYPDIVEIKIGEKVAEVKAVRCGEGKERICDFEVKTNQGTLYTGKSLIVTSGARRRKLGIPGEDKFEGKGVAYCSTCDAPLFKDKKVVVVGGGNAGLEAVHDLFAYASEVYLMEYGEALKGDPKTVEEIRKNPKLKEIFLNAKTLEVVGDQFVTGVKYKDLSRSRSEDSIALVQRTLPSDETSERQNNQIGDDSIKTLEVEGVFVEIGSVPNSEIVKDLVQIDEHGQIITNFQHARTSHPGVFAAGDVTDDPYKQNNISVGDGVRAALAAYAYLQNRAKSSPAAETHP